jgi:hypothetical protein
VEDRCTLHAVGILPAVMHYTLFKVVVGCIDRIDGVTVDLIIYFNHDVVRGVDVVVHSHRKPGIKWTRKD